MPEQSHDPKDSDSRPVKEDLKDYFKNHSRETISYILIILGILLLFFEPVYGGLLVGIVAGVYFGDEIVEYIKNWKTTIDLQDRYSGIARHLIIAGIALAFFISAPPIFLGAAIAIAIRYLFIGPESAK